MWSPWCSSGECVGDKGDYVGSWVKMVGGWFSVCEGDWQFTHPVCQAGQTPAIPYRVLHF